MRIKPFLLRNNKGFSLIEIIVIIIVASIAFTMIFKYFGSFITDSSVPIHRLNSAMELKQTAELIMENYHQDTSADLNSLKNNLSTNPFLYGQNFTVEYNQFVKFVNQNDTAIAAGDPEDLLKIKIRHDKTNEAITLLVVRQ